jgi:hypothetical protein
MLAGEDAGLGAKFLVCQPSAGINETDEDFRICEGVFEGREHNTVPVVYGSAYMHAAKQQTSRERTKWLAEMHPSVVNGLNHVLVKTISGTIPRTKVVGSLYLDLPGLIAPDGGGRIAGDGEGRYFRFSDGRGGIDIGREDAHLLYAAAASGRTTSARGDEVE